MNVFDEISDRLAVLSTYREFVCSEELYNVGDVLAVLCDVEEEYNIALKKDHPGLFDPSWSEDIAEKCEAGKQFSVSGSAEFIEMVREIAGSYGYSMYEWGISEHHARLAPPTEEIVEGAT